MLTSDQAIIQFQTQLFWCDDGKITQKEGKLIGRLEEMLEQVKRGEPLSVEDLGYVRHKTSRVPCFAEKYYPMVAFLERYQGEYKD